MKTWILVANRTQAKIFEYNNKRNSAVKYVTKLENPRGRLRPIEINADRPGAFANLETYGTKLEKQQSPIERIAQEFALKIAERLDSERRRKLFDELILIADPHFMGRLRGVLSKAVKQTVVREVVKDLGPVTTQELQSRLWQD